ncbi:hypothetical protein ACWEQO_23970 [Streptomyces sp. NPDC004051]
MAANSLDHAKQAVRTQVWDALTAADAVHDPSVHGRIPHFKGSEQAAARLARLPAWQRASVVKAVPDKAQLPVRARALKEGKTVYTLQVTGTPIPTTAYQDPAWRPLTRPLSLRRPACSCS